MATKKPTVRKKAARPPRATQQAAKKTPAKKTPAKKTPAKTVTAKPRTAKTVPAKTVPAKTVTAKTVTAKTVTAKKRAAPAKGPEARVRQLCLALPEAHEVEAWGSPTYRINNKLFAMYAANGDHKQSNRPAVWICSTPVDQDMVLRARPACYFKPPYVGPSGWIGAWLDGSPPWAEIGELLREGYRRRAPKKLAARIGD